MAKIENTITTEQFSSLEAREVDFIERFTRNWDALTEIMGIMRPVRKAPGTKLTASVAKVTLQDGSVPEGDEVPLSLAEVTPVVFEDLELKKYRKAVTAESVAKYGATFAVQKTNDAFLNELQGVVLDDFYEFAQTGTLKPEAPYETFQMAVSMAVARVKDKFKKMRKNYGNIANLKTKLICYSNILTLRKRKKNIRPKLRKEKIYYLRMIHI